MKMNSGQRLGIEFNISFLGITFSCTCSILAILFDSTGHSVDTSFTYSIILTLQQEQA